MAKREKPKGTQVGRPVEWTPETIETVRLHLDDFSKFPSFLHMCQWHAESNTYRDLLPMFCERNPLFSDTLKVAKTRAEAHTLDAGISGRLNPTVFVFTEKQHGWADTQKVEHSGGVSINLSYEVVTEAQDN